MCGFYATTVLLVAQFRTSFFHFQPTGVITRPVGMFACSAVLVLVEGGLQPALCPSLVWGVSNFLSIQELSVLTHFSSRNTKHPTIVVPTHHHTYVDCLVSTFREQKISRRDSLYDDKLTLLSRSFFRLMLAICFLYAHLRLAKGW